MTFSHFMFFRSGTPGALLSMADAARIKEIVVGTPGLKAAFFYTPTVVRDYYTDDGPSPHLALQLYFDELSVLEENIASKGHLQQLAPPAGWESLPNLDVEHQVMYVRPFPIPEKAQEAAPGATQCTYLVHYPGVAENFNEWLGYYLRHHPQIMFRFEGVRAIEIFTRVDWCDEMPWTRVHHMQRNLQRFDTRTALEAVLQSPIRHEMRADFEKFPPFTGSNIHFPMITERLTPQG